MTSLRKIEALKIGQEKCINYMNLYNVYFASKDTGPRTVQIEALNQSGAKAQVEARYPGAYNVILEPDAILREEETRLVIHLGDGFEGHKAWPAP